ncbi:MAG: hypothetical protein JKY54_07220 [Flavobacteriales bacterium]|nr:hypothetical protein [Flavobacteriales bacterium]
MKKMIIHSLVVQKKGAKLQFQIKLPSTIKGVKGILLTSNPVDDQRGVDLISGTKKLTASTPTLSAITRGKEVGWVWLRIPDKRDVFYCDTLRHSDHILNTYHGIDPKGLSEQPQWWFSGTKIEFFKVDVPIYNTMIEGYYEDRSTEAKPYYKVNIYLQLETK